METPSTASTTSTDSLTKSSPTAESPFHSGTNYQFAWDSTSLGYLKTCPRKYYYTMIRGLRRPGDSIHLEFGIWYHRSLENYDKLRAQGISHDMAQLLVVREVLTGTWGWEFDDQYKNRETLVRSFIWYTEQFRDDPATTVLLKNGKPAVELSFRFPIDSDLVLCGHLDRVVEFQGQNFVMDRKTTKMTISSYYFDQYSPDNQMSLYTIAGSVIHESPMRGVIIDAAQIAVGFTRFERAMVYRTEAQSEEWLSDFRFWVDVSYRFADRNQWPMNDKSCHQMGGCVFRSICASDARVRENLIASDFVVAPWNPLENR